jgi:hypothetical protein
MKFLPYIKYAFLGMTAIAGVMLSVAFLIGSIVWLSITSAKFFETAPDNAALFGVGYAVIFMGGLLGIIIGKSWETN